METAIFGGGCFWCLEAVFEQIDGVSQVVPGYAGGDLANPDYAAVCSGSTGHAEVVEVLFDPQKISYRQLLEVFFAIHDPTSLNRQGADVGTQYRSVIFTRDESQRAVARSLIDALAKERFYAEPVVTAVLEAPVFYPAEPYHQGYFKNNPGQAYCAVVIGPKVLAVRRKFAGLLRSADQ